MIFGEPVHIADPGFVCGISLEFCICVGGLTDDEGGRFDAFLVFQIRIRCVSSNFAFFILALSGSGFRLYSFDTEVDADLTDASSLFKQQ